MEKLLQLKRLEKPVSDFWDGFEHELKQKQLHALMRPSVWQRIRLLFEGPRWTALTPAWASVIVCVAVGSVVFSLFNGTDSEILRTAMAEVPEQTEEVILTIEGGNEEVVARSFASPEAPAIRRTGSHFVEDVLTRPEVEPFARDTFRTVAETETFVASSDHSAEYVVNVFTAFPGIFYGENGPLEF